MTMIEPYSSGIYRIYCKSTQKSYIGSSKNVFYRIGTHIRMLSANKHYIVSMQEDWNTYGRRDFTFDLLKELACPKDFATAEREAVMAVGAAASYNSTWVDRPKNSRIATNTSCNPTKPLILGSLEIADDDRTIDERIREKLCTTEEFAVMHGISGRTVQHWISRGIQMPLVSFFGNLRFLRTEAMAFDPPRTKRGRMRR